MQQRCRTLHVIALIVGITFSNQVVSSYQDPCAPSNPSGGKPVDRPSPWEHESSIVETFLQEKVIPVAAPATIIGVGTRMGVEVARKCGLSEKKAFVAGTIVENVATVISHIHESRHLEGDSLTCFNVAGKHVQVDLKTLATQVVIANATFYGPEILSKVRSYFWPAKKKENKVSHRVCRSCKMSLCKACGSSLQ